jgi:hypothetical protein
MFLPQKKNAVTCITYKMFTKFLCSQLIKIRLIKTHSSDKKVTIYMQIVNIEISVGE